MDETNWHITQRLIRLLLQHEGVLHSAELSKEYLTRRLKDFGAANKDQTEEYVNAVMYRGAHPTHLKRKNPDPSHPSTTPR